MILKRAFWFLTVEEKSPALYSLPYDPPRGRTRDTGNGIVVEQVLQWFCHPHHVDHFRAAGVQAKADPYCPLYTRGERRWRWERKPE